MTKTAIEWTDRSWNPVTGCDKVSPGCDNCYALTMAGRLKRMGSKRYQRDGDPRTSGPGFGLTLHPDKLHQPYSWRKPSMVFVNSMSDLFHPDVPDTFIEKVFSVMRDTPEHTYQVLTKRPQRMAELANESPALSPWPANVWPGTSVETRRYLFRIHHLHRIEGARVRMVSAEPLLGPLVWPFNSGKASGMAMWLPAYLDALCCTARGMAPGTVEWIIVGGESGPGKRPMDPDWARDIRDQCAAVGVPFFMKQMDKIKPIPDDLMIREFPDA